MTGEPATVANSEENPVFLRWKKKIWKYFCKKLLTDLGRLQTDLAPRLQKVQLMALLLKAKPKWKVRSAEISLCDRLPRTHGFITSTNTHTYTVILRSVYGLSRNFQSLRLTSVYEYSSLFSAQESPET